MIGSFVAKIHWARIIVLIKAYKISEQQSNFLGVNIESIAFKAKVDPFSRGEFDTEEFRVNDDLEHIVMFV